MELLPPSSAGARERAKVRNKETSQRAAWGWLCTKERQAIEDGSLPHSHALVFSISAGNHPIGVPLYTQTLSTRLLTRARSGRLCTRADAHIISVYHAV